MISDVLCKKLSLFVFISETHDLRTQKTQTFNFKGCVLWVFKNKKNLFDLCSFLVGILEAWSLINIHTSISGFVLEKHEQDAIFCLISDELDVSVCFLEIVLFLSEIVSKIIGIFEDLCANQSVSEQMKMKNTQTCLGQINLFNLRILFFGFCWTRWIWAPLRSDTHFQPFAF